MSGDSELPFWLEGEPRPASVQDMKLALFYSVQPDYLRTMGIPLRRGRFIVSSDDEHAPLVAAVDERLAQKYFPGWDPIGRHLNLDFIGKVEIVGIADTSSISGSTRTRPLRSSPAVPLTRPDSRPVRSARRAGYGRRAHDQAASGLMESICREVSRMNSRQVTWGAQTMEEIIGDSLAARRVSMFLLGSSRGWRWCSRASASTV